MHHISFQLITSLFFFKFHVTKLVRGYRRKMHIFSMRTTKQLERGVQLIETTSGYRLISVKQRKLELSPHKVNSFVFFFFLRHCLLSFKCLLRFNSLLSFFIGLQKLKATQLLDMFSVTRVTAKEAWGLLESLPTRRSAFPCYTRFLRGQRKLRQSYQADRKLMSWKELLLQLERLILITSLQTEWQGLKEKTFTAREGLIIKRNSKNPTRFCRINQPSFDPSRTLFHQPTNWLHTRVEKCHWELKVIRIQGKQNEWQYQSFT